MLSLGKFDGLHRGHELLMEYMAEKKKERTELKAVIFTFDIPPRGQFSNVPAQVLTTNQEKMKLFESIGIDYLIECPFTREIMCMEPETFIEKIALQLNVKYMVVGTDFRFGHNRRGDYRLLQQFAEVYPSNFPKDSTVGSLISKVILCFMYSIFLSYLKILTGLISFRLSSH
mgnify:CR=1 FL=1